MSKHGILMISHGSKETSWVLQVEETVKSASNLFYERYAKVQQLPLEQAADEVPIYSAYLELVDGKLIQDGINALQNKGVTHIHVMPLFVSYGSTHVEEIRQAFGFEQYDDFQGELQHFEYEASIHFAEPIAEDEEVIQLLLRQLEALSVHQEEEAVLLLGHGSSYPAYYARWEQNMLAIANKLLVKSSFAEVAYASLLPEHSREKLQQLLEKDYARILVIPLFISAGYFTNKVIPMRLEGLSYVYSGDTLLPSDEMIHLLARRFKEFVGI